MGQGHNGIVSKKRGAGVKAGSNSRGSKRAVRPFRRWVDDLRATAEALWRRKIYDRDLWWNLGEALAIKQDHQAPVS